MKKNKKIVLICTFICLIVIGTVVGIIMYLRANTLTVNEKKWIDENSQKQTLLSINVLNNSSVFGSDGTGVFYDFLDSFAEKYNLNINKVTFNYGSVNGAVSLNLKQSLTDNDEVFYEDHYVLIGNNSEIITNLSDISNSNIAILNNDLSNVSKYLTSYSLNYKTYEDIDSLFTSMNENKYAIVPLHLYLNNIFNNNKEIIYHFSDINIYYVLTTNDDILSSILKKYYDTWKENFEESYDENLFSLISNKLGLTEYEIEKMRSISYKYGYVNNSPYEVISGGNYGGIVAVYLQRFMTFSGTDFTFKKYSNFAKFNKAVTNNEIDAYFGYYNLNSFNKTSSGVDVNYVVIANIKNDVVINSINALTGKEVYVQNNSLLYSYLSNVSGVQIKTYKNAKELTKLNNKDCIILVDSNIYEYYKTHGLGNYTIRTSGSLKEVYNFRIKDNGALYKLLNKYITVLDSHKILN